MTDRPRLLEPSRLDPVDVDLARVTWVGIGLWAVALVVCAVLAGNDRLSPDWVWVCATGIVLGLLAIVWLRRRR